MYKEILIVEADIGFLSIDTLGAHTFYNDDA